ncbi:HAD family hydrolase, partial [Staphylococcus epidermidis]
FLFQHILHILKHLSSKHKLHFIPQTIFPQNQTFYNFYLYSSPHTHLHKTILQHLTQYSNTTHYTITFNPSNPLPPHPQNPYHINFTPNNPPKLYPTKFLINKYPLPKQLIIPFRHTPNHQAF